MNIVFVLFDGLTALDATGPYEVLSRVPGVRVTFTGLAAGVSAGIDLGLTLAAELAGLLAAQAIQLGIEYDPKPPFDAGDAGRAPAALKEMVLGR